MKLSKSKIIFFCRIDFSQSKFILVTNL
jgi:hypothetical protein